jgi:hypothetical protein
MAGRLVASTLNNDTGVLATQNGMTGIAKAWVNFDGTASGAIRASFNVSSVTQQSTGSWRVNFTTAMPNANYVIVGSAGTGNNNYFFNKNAPQLTTYCDVVCLWPSTAYYNDAQMQVAILGS